jgi:hypothetical protein
MARQQKARAFTRYPIRSPDDWKHLPDLIRTGGLAHSSNA